MSWRRAVVTILFSPILIGFLVLAAYFVVVRLPAECCERRRAVRHLPYVGLAYYGLAVPLLLVALGLAWREVLIGTALFALGGNWLLPDPFTYVLNPRKRRAVKLAIEHVEVGDGPGPIYGRVNVIGSEVGRTIVSVVINSDTIPSRRRFLGVADESAAVEELDFEYVSSKHRVRAWL